MLKVWIAGGREYPFEDQIFEALDELRDSDGEQLAVIHGASRPYSMLEDGMNYYVGVDYFASQYAFARALPEIKVPANWTALGKEAAHIRDGWIANILKPDILLLFPGGKEAESAKDVANIYRIPVRLGGSWISPPITASSSEKQGV